MKQSTTNGIRLGSLIAILSMFFFIPDFNIIASVLGLIAESYPGISKAGITYLLTSVNLAQMAAALVTGIILGRRITYKNLALIAIGIHVVFGSLPFFFGEKMSFAALLTSRIIFGLGLGCWLPICQSYLSNVYTDENKRANMLGIGMALFNVGMIIGTMAGGILGRIHWRYAFGFYLLGAISFVLVALFLEEPKMQVDTKSEKIRIPKEAIGILCLYMFVQVIVGIFSTYISYVVTEFGGSPVLTSSIMSVFGIACIVIALLFGPLYRMVKQYFFIISCTFLVISYLLFFIAGSMGGTTTSIALMFIGAVLIGFGLNSISTGIPMLLGITVPQASLTAAISASVIFMNVGSFLTSPVMQVVTKISGEDAPAYVAYIAAFIFSVILLAIVVPFSIKLRKIAKEKEAAPGMATGV